MSKKVGKAAAVASAVTWLLSGKTHKRHRKKRAVHDADAIDNIERLYRLKKRGAISEEDFEQLKNILKERV